MTAKPRHCLECSEALTGPRPGQEFCCKACRMEFTNRRRDRGADMYDLFRALRRERPTAKAMNLWTQMCRLELKWEEEDQRDRPGRRSYMPPKKAISNLEDKGSLQRGEILQSIRIGRAAAR